MEQIYVTDIKLSLKAVMFCVITEVRSLSDFVFSTRTLRLEVIVEGLVFGFRLC
jgi:hypothetical protein